MYYTSVQGILGLEVVDTLIILLKDKREIIERISHAHIDCFINLLQNRVGALSLFPFLCVCVYVFVCLILSVDLSNNFWLLNFQHHRHLDLLGVLCVCKDDCLADNQRYITNTWLKGNRV